MTGLRYRAAVLRSSGEPLAIEELLAPELAMGQVLVRLDYSGICRSQLMEVRGMRGADPWLPHLLGHEGSGRVVAVGPGVSKVEAGDEVILGWIKGKGLDVRGPQFQAPSGHINAGPVTTFGEYSIASENRVFLKPASVSGPEATLFGCALLTGAGMALQELAHDEPTSVLLLGLGGVGLSALIGVLALGPALVIAADPSPAKRALALRLGATHALDPMDPDFVLSVQQVSDGGVQECIESGGTVSSIELGFACLQPKGGSLVFASHPPAGERISLDPFELINGKQIRGSWGGSAEPDVDIPRLAAIVADSGIDLGLLVDASYTLDSINQALADLDGGIVVRPCIDLREAGEF
ncbi:MAG: zinc-binding dehydrogenase [Actinomycetota bacterium]|nr:zinc-binding dehydrogenase [Actinomycetota bacterium]